MIILVLICAFTLRLFYLWQYKSQMVAVERIRSYVQMEQEPNHFAEEDKQNLDSDLVEAIFNRDKTSEEFENGDMEEGAQRFNIFNLF